MSANVGSDVFVDARVLVDTGQEIAIISEAYLRKLPFVAFQYLDDGREKHHVILCAGLDTCGAWDDECSFVFFGFGKVGLHQVRIAEAGVALHDEQVQCLVIGWSGRCPCTERVQFFHGQVCARLCLESSLLELCIGILFDDAVCDGFVDE